ncbi:MAG: hypothetical protein V4858_17225 [Pseudomonadota bacterium]
MSLQQEPNLPQNPDTPYAKALNYSLKELFRSIARQVNALGGGRIGGTDNASTAAPTTGMYAVGDFVRNSAPTELGSASSKYVILGWVCTVSGTPGTFLQCRVLTGN